MTDHRHHAAIEREAKPRGRGRFWLALLAMAGLCAFVLYRSALFRMERLEITGRQRLSQERIMEAAGLTPGAPRWQHPAAAIEAQLKQEPWIQSAKATWDWGRVKLQITERPPVALLRYSGRYYLVLDETGMILGQSELSPTLGLPVVSHQEVTKAIRGQTLNDAGLQDALFLLSRMGEPLRAQVSEVRVADNRSLSLFMLPGATVEWGQVDTGNGKEADTAEKLTLFGGIWNEPHLKRGTSCHIDLRIDPTRGDVAGCN